MPTQSQMIYERLSPAERQTLDDLLSRTTMRSDGTIDGQYSQVLADLMRQPIAASEQRLPQQAPRQMPENYVRRGDGQVIDLGASMPLHDVWVSGPEYGKLRELADGRLEREVRMPRYDEFGRQTSMMRTQTITPDYLNPARIKEIEYKKKLQELEPKQEKPTLVDGQWVYPPSQNAPAGIAVPVGGFVDKKSEKSAQTSEDERKTAYNVSRIINSAKIMQNAMLGKDGKEALSPGFLEAAAGELPSWVPGAGGLQNLARLPSRQIVSQSQADIIDALLYLATGATYNKEQLAQQRSSYLPNFTDSPEAIDAKNERIRGQIESAKLRSGRAWTPELESALNSLFIPKVKEDNATGSNAPQQGRQVPPVATASPQAAIRPRGNLTSADAEAIMWLMNNKDDPMADMVRQKLGIR